MILSYELQNAYNQFYKDMREYIWSYETIEALASLEVSIYRACPNLTEVRSCLDRLKSFIFSNMLEDEELKTSFNKVENLVGIDATVGCMLNQVKEVIPVEDNEKSEPEVGD